MLLPERVKRAVWELSFEEVLRCLDPALRRLFVVPSEYRDAWCSVSDSVWRVGPPRGPEEPQGYREWPLSVQYHLHTGSSRSVKDIRVGVPTLGDLDSRAERGDRWAFVAVQIEKTREYHASVLALDLRTRTAYVFDNLGPSRSPVFEWFVDGLGYGFVEASRAVDVDGDCVPSIVSFATATLAFGDALAAADFLASLDERALEVTFAGVYAALWKHHESSRVYARLDGRLSSHASAAFPLEALPPTSPMLPDGLDDAVLRALDDLSTLERRLGTGLACTAVMEDFDAVQREMEALGYRESAHDHGRNFYVDLGGPDRNVEFAWSWVDEDMFGWAVDSSDEDSSDEAGSGGRPPRLEFFGITARWDDHEIVVDPEGCFSNALLSDRVLSALAARNWRLGPST